MKASLMYPCILLAVIIAGGCSYKTKPDAAALHDLGVVLTRSDDQAVSPKIEVIAPEWLRDTRVHYRQLHINPTIVRFYNMNRWVAQPAALLSKHFSMISVREALFVKIRLLDFEQRFDAPKQAKAVLSFEAEVYKPSEKAPIARRMFHFEQVNASADALGAINGFAELTAGAVASLSVWLNGLQ